VRTIPVSRNQGTKEKIMDAEFEIRWREGRFPFDGTTVALTEYVPLATLREALLIAVGHLRQYRPTSTLWCLDDWHAHDGCVTEAQRTTWQELDALLSSSDGLKAASTGDTYVCRGYFPVERDYYLRLYVPDVSDNPFHAHDDPNLVEVGLFDLTCQWPMAKRIAEEIGAVGIQVIELVPAKEFFDRSYSG
jgi:hypothetical protein